MSDLSRGGRVRADRRPGRGADDADGRREPTPASTEDASTPSWPTTIEVRGGEAPTRRPDRPVAAAEPVALTPQGNKRGVTDLGGDRLPPAAGQRARAGQRRQGPRPARPRSGRPQAGRDARPLRGRGEDRRHRQRPARLPLRAAPGARHQGEEGDRALQRPRLRAGLDRHPHPGADPRQAGGRGRGAEHAPPHRPPRRHLRRPPAEDLAAGRLARQGDRRQRRSGPTWRRCRTCSSPAPPARASPAASTRSSPRS